MYKDIIDNLLMATIDDYESGSDDGDREALIDMMDDGVVVGGMDDEGGDMDEEIDYTVPPIDMYNDDDGMAGGATKAVEADEDEDDKAPPNADVEADADTDDDEDDVDLSEKYKKLKNLSHIDLLKTAHPESISVNYQEIDALTTLVHDERKNIIDPLHITPPLLTKYEKARIIGLRSVQLDNGAKPFINIDDKVINSILIAQEELKLKKLPFIIKRPLPNGGAEYWKVSDLEDVVHEG